MYSDKINKYTCKIQINEIYALINITKSSSGFLTTLKTDGTPRVKAFRCLTNKTNVGVLVMFSSVR